MIDWDKYGFKELEDSHGYVFEDKNQFPLILAENNNGTLSVYRKVDAYYDALSDGQIPATNQSVVLLLKAFAVKREKK